MAGVGQKSMYLLGGACNAYPHVTLAGGQRSQFNVYLDKIMATLTEKIGDNLQKVRSSAEEAFLAVAGHPQFGVKLCVAALSNDNAAPPKAKGRKPVLSSKALIAKYQILHKMLVNFSFDRDLQITTVKYAVKGINNTSNDVRLPAYDCMGELYRIMGGDEISRYYEGLKQAQLDVLMAKFSEIDDGGVPTKQPKKQAAPPK